MTRAQHLQNIAFDLYERYILLERVAELFRPQRSPYRVLDVGGHTPSFWDGFPSLAGALVPDANVVVVDQIPTADLRDYVRASGMQLPFRDETFDFVCSFDTLEHIPAEERAQFMAELLRVTRDGLYLAFPFASETNRWAESVVLEYTSVVLKDPLPALTEHRQFGLPIREDVTGVFSHSKHAWISFDQGNTDVWLLMMLTYHSLRLAGTDFVQQLNARFNQAYAAQDWSEPAYRAAYLLSKRRAAGDLEAVRASLPVGEKRADLQGLLAFCQLFLTIAQNGRVNVDKDRHIHNIEHELAAARMPRERWDDVARLLCDLEARLVEKAEAPSGSEPGDWSGPRVARLREAVGAIRTAELEKELSRTAAELESMRGQLGGLHGRLDSRMRDLEIGLVTNRRAIQAIYDSRIWKALSSVGGWFLRLTGRQTTPVYGRAGAYSDASAGRVSRSNLNVPGEFVELVCDYPGAETVLPVQDVVEIRGWAVAKSGIDHVLIQIGSDPPITASYGIPRPDVARNFSETPAAEHSGFRFFWDTTRLPEGPCTIRITAVAQSGQTREAVCTVMVDWKTPAGYGLWIVRNEPTAADLLQIRLDDARLAVRPRISIAVPVYKTDLSLITRCIDSVLNQTYAEWELCLADDGSQDAALGAVLQKYAERDSRIHLVTLERNRGISAATNAAVQLCTGGHVAFLDHDDELAPFALSEVARAINEHPDTDLFYSDEDKIDEQGRRYDAFFKPDWSPDLFRSCNYVCHFVVMRRPFLEQVGGLNESYSGSQDYELLLRASERTQKIRRIPKILYHWRAIAGSAAKDTDQKPEASADGLRALTAYFDRNVPGVDVQEVGACRYRVRYPIVGEPRVTILIPTGGHKNVFRALDQVLEKTTYKNYEIVVIDNSHAARVQEYVARLTARKAPVRHMDWRGKPFNFARMNNEAVRGVDTPYVLFLNDDTAVISPEWLTAMLEHAQRKEVGAVGAQLWYPNGIIQHAGVVMGIHGNCSHAFKGLPGGLPHYFDFPNLIRNCSAVTGACLLVARDKFLEAGAFDEVNLAVAFQDVDLCLKLLELGYRNVYTPYAKLYHFESATKTEKDKIPDPVEDAFMKKKWAKYIADDPYYNPNLARRREDFSLAID